MRGHTLTDFDFIIISQSEVTNYKKYASLPLERLPLFHHLVYPRMIYYEGGFRSHLDILNKIKYGVYTYEADDTFRKNLYSIWNLPGFSGIHIAAYLQQYGISSYVINNIDSQWETFCQIYKSCKKPPLVGLSTTFHLNYSEIKRIIEKIRRPFPNLETVLGGGFLSTQTTFEHINDLKNVICKNNITYTLTAFNPEEDIKQLLLDRKAQRSTISEIPNLIYFIKKGDTASIIQTETIWHDPFLQYTELHKLDLPFINSTIQIRLSSGCPFCCAFCSYPETAHGFYLMSEADVEKQIHSAMKISGINNLIFIDDTLNIPEKRFRSLCCHLKKYAISWFSFLRVQFIDDEIASIMKDSGCQAVFLGIESANDTILQNMHKRATKEKYIRGIASLKKYGIKTMAAFIIGFPGETETTIKENIDFIESSGLDFYTLKDFYYIKNTPIYTDRRKYSLSGMGEKWSHATMDSVQAHQVKIDMFLRINQSVFIDPDTSLWYLAYLFDKGFSMEKIVEVQNHLNQIMKDQLNNNINDQHPCFQMLSTLLC
jgi:anaerobic magnesium-protoporphyrin IX monomethyl ester cyclase